MLGVASRRGGGGQKEEEPEEGEAHGVDAWRMSQQVLRVALLTTPLALSEPRKVCHPFEESWGLREAHPSAEGGGNVAALGLSVA